MKHYICVFLIITALFIVSACKNGTESGPAAGSQPAASLPSQSPPEASDKAAEYGTPGSTSPSLSAPVLYPPVSAMPSQSNEKGDYVIKFKDKKLEAVIRNTIKKPQGDIYRSDVKKIEELYINGLDIESIEGIQHLANLRELFLSNNNISDLTPLKGLKNLTSLNLDHNCIQDISPLSGLLNLRVLGLLNNFDIDDITALKNLYNLQVLSLDNASITDISPLSNLKMMKKLSLNGNNISNMEPLKGLTRMEALYLSANYIEELFVSDMKSLQFLDLSFNKVADISQLAGLTNLEYLILLSNNISSIDDLNSLVKLKGLYLSDNKIKSIAAVTRMQALENLDIANNPITDPTPVSSLENLTNINLWGSQDRDRIIQTAIAAKNIANSVVKPEMSDFEAAKALHDYLITNADFDYEMFEKSYIPEYGYDAYSILVEGIGISDGFSNAMSLLLNMCNIENMWVYGFLAGEADGAHTWNIAKIGDYYYHIDVTFDDMLSIGDSISYRYFCLSDNQIAIDHVWGAYTDLYPCVMDNPDIMVY